ncbi:hypothetical protein THAOC_12922 [Thalassiosira oceanica]|uniref:Uncharacterized protein n=1 Tax=Thalassiosira oceanica TaxID=159749 RepID=K0SMJ5_THAOC|nr:hypothetical protein THAOC_12922 [Thalassiosira oceanica]|mmetsp:Transcript_588/g.1325  ORF Transcript_588/g.1325 Transcript_588/m.1325 type:complete len:336 (+) Transcript_588:92-1099(+)|eukprot:EJK66174.1 hypothetical protein THAOC_12922 [Thalassiosira oceanica]
MKAGIVSTAAALASVSCGSAFAPSRTHQSSPASVTRGTPLSSSAIAAVPKMSNPYKNLPWNTDREEAREIRRLTLENAALFRELGLPEDATYEDVDTVTKQLIALTEDPSLPKNEGLKRKIKIEIARDKIYQIRLNERITGVRDGAGEKAEAADKWDEGGLLALQELGDSVDDIIKPKKKLRIPIISGLIEYSQSIYQPPDDQWKNRQITIWGLSTLFCLLVPTLTEGFFRLNWLPAGGIMGYRGMPGMEDVGSGYNPFRGKRNKKHQVQAIMISLFLWTVGRGLAYTFVSRIPAMATSRSEQWFRFALVQGMLGTACSFLQTYKGDEGNPELMI